MTTHVKIGTLSVHESSLNFDMYSRSLRDLSRIDLTVNTVAIYQYIYCADTKFLHFNFSVKTYLRSD